MPDSRHRKDFPLIARGDQPRLKPTLHGRHRLVQSLGQRGLPAEKNCDSQGGRVRPLLALPDDFAHTRNYARNVRQVNVDFEAALDEVMPVVGQSHSLGDRLRRLQQRSGLTMQQLALLMGYKNASSIQRYLMPDYGEVGVLPVNLATKFTDAMAGRGEPPIEAGEIFALAGVELTERGTMRPFDITKLFPATVADSARPFAGPLPSLDDLMTKRGVADLPVYGTALGADLDMTSTTGQIVAVEQATLDMSEAVEFVRRPPGLVSRRDAYALIVAGSSMSPRYEDGEMLLVDPRRPPAPGQDVIVQMVDDSGQDGADRVVCVMVKRLVRRSASWIELEQFNPRVTFRLDMANVKAIHRVVTMTEMLGN